MEKLKRRDFLKVGTAAAAGAMLMGTKKTFAQSTSANSKLNIALVGVGQEGRVLLASLLLMKDVNIVAICDIWEYNTRRARGMMRKIFPKVNTYVNIDQMLEKEKTLDGVIIATPDFWHAPHTIKCLEAGINVYCEKMMSNTIEGARSMVKAMDKTGKLLQIGHQRHSNPRYQFVLENLIKKNKICGTITNAQAQWNRAVTLDMTCNPRYNIDEKTLKEFGYKDMHQFLNWRWYKGLGGGVISDLGSHQIDIFEWFLGCKPHSILAGGGVDYYDHEWHDNVMCIYEYRKPDASKKEGYRTIRAFYQVLTTTSAGGGYWEQFMGDKGTIKVAENPAWTKLFKENGSDLDWDTLVADGLLSKDTAPAEAVQIVDVRQSAAPATYNLPHSIDFKEPIHYPHLKNFMDAIRGEAKLTCDGKTCFSKEAAVFKVRDAIEAKKMLYFSKEDFEA